MHQVFLIATYIVATTTIASSQVWKPVIDKWRGCADAAAARYAKSSETAREVTRLSALSCISEKKQAWQAVTQVEGSSFADQYIDAAESHYLDRLAVDVVEMRLQSSKKP